MTKTENTIKSWYVLLLIPVCLAAFLSSSRAQEPLPDLVARIKPSVVAIVTYDKRGKRVARGSGFCVAPNKVITNKHVVEGARRIEVRTYDDKVFPVSKILGDDKEGDLVLLQTDDWPAEIKPLIVATAPPREGERVVVIGNPLGLEGSISDGIVAAFRTLRGVGTLIQITAPISPGSSGSPVVNMLGYVVGIATLNLEGGQNLNFAIASERIIALWSNQLVVSPAISSTESQPVVADYDQLLQVLGMSAVPSTESQPVVPGVPADDQRLSAEDLYSKGRNIMLRRSYAEALPYFRATVAKAPDYSKYVSPIVRKEHLKVHAAAYFCMGQIFYETKEYEEAVEALKQSISLNPDSDCSTVSGDASACRAYHYLGLSYYALKQYRDAEESFKAAIRLNDGDQQLRKTSVYSLGMTYYYDGNMEAALEQQKLLNEVDPEMAAKLSSLLKNISGYWKSSSGDSYQIVDDGKRVEVKYYYLDNRSLKYEAQWAGNIAIGIIFNSYSRYRFVMKAVDSTHIWFRHYGDLNLKDPPDKVQKKAIKEAEKEPVEIWTRIQ